MKNIYFYTKYSELGASSRLRFYQYKKLWLSKDIDIAFSPLFCNLYIEKIYNKKKVSFFYIIKSYISRVYKLLSHKNGDILWVQAELFPYFFSIFERYLKFRGVKLIFEYDDAIFHNYDSGIKSIFFKNKITNVMKTSSAIIVGNNYLWRYAVDACGQSSKVFVVPTSVEEEKYLAPNLLLNNSSDKLIVGWIGTPNTQKSLKLIEEITSSKFIRDNVRFKLIGANCCPLVNVEYELVEWSEDKEVDDIYSIDVGIMPLFDIPFEKGKCSYKLIQYMMCGKPVIASPVGMNSDVVKDKVNGFLCNTTEQWINAIVYFCKNKEQISFMGDKAKEYSCKNFTSGKSFEELHKIYLMVSKT
jgi:glycosyltransferase involved in cell wall biosynthesis